MKRWFWYWFGWLWADEDPVQEGRSLCSRHGGEFYLGCMGICSLAPHGVQSCPMPKKVGR